MASYSHTQPGTLLRISLVVPAVAMLASSAFVSPKERTIFIAVATTLVLALALFHSLCTSIDANYLRLRFGVGLISFKYRLTDITEAIPVKNKWYDGWGIRVLPNGFLFNVSGPDAVEIRLSSGSIRRIGTNEPSALTQAVNDAIHGHCA